MIVGLGLIAPFFIYIFAGVAAQILLRHGAEQQRWLDAFIFYLALPALLFQSVRVVPPSAASLFAFLAVTTAMTAMMFLLGWLIGRGNTTGDHPAVFGLAASYSNIGYMGPALTVAVLGPAAGAPAAFIFCADVLLIFTIWPAMIASGSRGSVRIVQSLKKVVTHPFILATLAGLLFARTGWTLPIFLDTPLTGFQHAAAPAALFSLGLTLARNRGGQMGARLGSSWSVTRSLWRWPLRWCPALTRSGSQRPSSWVPYPLLRMSTSWRGRKASVFPLLPALSFSALPFQRSRCLLSFRCLPEWGAVRRTVAFQCSECLPTLPR